jgi:hypothetical protein
MEATQHPYLFLIQAERVVPLYEVPKGRASIISLRPIRLAVFVLIHFNHVGTALSGRKWYEDSATQNEGSAEVLTNAIALLVSKLLGWFDFKDAPGTQQPCEAGGFFNVGSIKAVCEFAL